MGRRWVLRGGRRHRGQPREPGSSSARTQRPSQPTDSRAWSIKHPAGLSSSFNSHPDGSRDRPFPLLRQDPPCSNQTQTTLADLSRYLLLLSLLCLVAIQIISGNLNIFSRLEFPACHLVTIAACSMKGVCPERQIHANGMQPTENFAVLPVGAQDLIEGLPIDCSVIKNVKRR